jgi:single-strand DNA-binding protein
MPYLAQATVMGNLGRDVETKYIASGKALHTFSVAVTEKKGDDKVTSWFNVNVWGDLIQWKLDELKKGALVLVSGRLAVETWEKDGVKGSKTVITADPFSGVQVFGGGGEKQDGGVLVSQPRSSRPPAQNYSLSQEIDDESVPF